ncbi:glycosyltransferase family 4 protein [Paenibacillus xylaniclasticus]|uniref:glycosyltransferase family 4 protein n=1 Tax=Paenibacillus xylaniclasticus TaxID=588083 RepID=UPI000FDB9C0C|nr:MULTISPECIES: glycosyltransferase family 4 protein [Paenibacillus]GFN32767.1 glycosyl transferase [Paenibacillus curdlanolyticus]
MKVMQVANSKKVKGGITSVVNSIEEGLSDRVAIARHPSYISGVPAPLKIAYSLLAMFKFICLVHPYRIIHLHSAANGSFYRKTIYTYMSKLFRKKVIFHIHGSSFEAFHDKSSFNAWLINKTLNRADEIIVLSNQMKQLVLAYCSNTQISILPNPITIPSQAVMKQPKDNTDKIQLLFMGEIGQRKGIYDLVDAIRLLPKEISSKLVLNICGNNELDKLRSYIQERDVGHACIVHGWIDGEKKRTLLANSDIYVLPSYHEGLPVSILEAMANELPIISTTVGGIPEIVLNDVNGYIMPPGSIEHLAESIEKLVNNEDLRVSFGRKSKSMVKNHDIRIVAKQLHDIYKRINASS